MSAGETATDPVPTTIGASAGAAIAADEPIVALTSGASAGGPRVASMLPPALAFAALVLAYTTVDIVAPALPSLQRSLALSATGAGLVWSVFFGGRLVTNLPAAWLIGRVGPRATGAAGAGSLLVGSLLAATAGQEPALLIARGLQGAGIALLVNAGLLSLLRAWPGRGAAMTAFNVAAGVGTSAGLLSGGLLTGYLGWRAVFWLSAGVGAGLLAGAILSRTGAAQTSSRPTAEGHEDAPARATWPALAGASLANLMVYANYSVWVLLLSLYITQRFGATPEVIGLIQFALNAVHLAVAFPIGRLIRRFGPRDVLAGGFAVTAVGLALALVAPNPLWLLGPLALYATGQMAGNSGAGDLVLRLGGRGGRAVGMVRLTSDLGLVVGPFAVGRLVDVAGVAAPFAVLAALSGLGAVAVLGMRLRTAAADEGARRPEESREA